MLFYITIFAYSGLLELEASLPDFVTNPRIKAPKPRSGVKAGFIKRKDRQENELKDMYQVSENDILDYINHQVQTKLKQKVK